MPSSRRSLVAAALVMAVACRGNSVAPTATAPTDVVAQFDQLWATFDRNYSYFDYKRIDWNALRAEFAPRVAGATDRKSVV